MEHELRFYFPSNKYDDIIAVLDTIPRLHSSIKLYEKTIQYNHCSPQYDFYDSSVDGRFRLRVSNNELTTKCKLSWKRRLKDTTSGKVNVEEEKEVRINPEDIDNFTYIIENVMHFQIVESYERYRTIYENNEIEIAIDEYPFGLCLEIENKSINKDPNEVVLSWVKRLNLNPDDAFRLSWDDMYAKLCQEQNIELYKEVTFDKPMPHIK